MLRLYAGAGGGLNGLRLKIGEEEEERAARRVRDSGKRGRN